jgi:phosphohistidine phosphatase SixA
VIYFRHAAVDPSQIDAEPINFKNCARQRNLHDRGRADARAIGESFLALNIPVGQVLGSEYCRARETALLAFGQVETSSDLTAYPPELAEERIAALRQMLSAEPAPGTNTILVGHGLNLANTADLTIREGEAAVFLPLGADGFELVARVLPEEWKTLEQVAAGLPGGKPSRAPNLMLPDLRTLPPANLLMRVNPVTGQKLLRFTNSVQNDGPGALELIGYSGLALEKTIVVQKIYTSGSLFQHVMVGEFIFHPEHDHWHLGGFARYEIWSLRPNGGLDSMVAVSDKVSYCLRDDARSNLPGASRRQAYLGCNQEKQGISAGWMDIYYYHLPDQSINVTHLPDGIYALRSVVNSENLLWEQSRANNAAMIYFEIVGDYLSRADVAEILRKSPNSQE